MWHPANRLLAWCALTLWVSILPFMPLMGCTFALIFIAYKVVPHALKRSLYRIRWLLLSLLIIFAWNTPGVYLIRGWYAPSVEGLYMGVQHILRIMVAIVGLQIVLRKMDVSMLLSACYQLSWPLRIFGLNSERFAVRLGLTLQYAERWLIDKNRFSWRTLGIEFDTIARQTVVPGMVVEILPFSEMEKVVSLGWVFFILLFVVSRILL